MWKSGRGRVDVENGMEEVDVEEVGMEEDGMGEVDLEEEDVEEVDREEVGYHIHFHDCDQFFKINAVMNFFFFLAF